jgi:hypothetical protein
MRHADDFDLDDFDAPFDFTSPVTLWVPIDARLLPYLNALAVHKETDPSLLAAQWIEDRLRLTRKKWRRQSKTAMVPSR